MVYVSGGVNWEMGRDELGSRTGELGSMTGELGNGTGELGSRTVK